MVLVPTGAGAGSGSASVSSSRVTRSGTIVNMIVAIIRIVITTTVVLLLTLIWCCYSDQYHCDSTSGTIIVFTHTTMIGTSMYSSVLKVVSLSLAIEQLELLSVLLCCFCCCRRRSFLLLLLPVVVAVVARCFVPGSIFVRLRTGRY